MQVYQALLSRPDSIERVRQARPNIERVGGRVVIEPPTNAGMTVVTLWLPEPYRPEQFLSDLPFYPA